MGPLTTPKLVPGAAGNILVGARKNLEAPPGHWAGNASDPLPGVEIQKKLNQHGLDSHLNAVRNNFDAIISAPHDTPSGLVECLRRIVDLGPAQVLRIQKKALISAQAAPRGDRRTSGPHEVGPAIGAERPLGCR